MTSDSSNWARIAANSPGTVLLKTTRPDEENRTSFLFSKPREIIAAYTLDKIRVAFEQLEQALAEGHYVAGFVSYEAGYAFEPTALRSHPQMQADDLPLVWFGVYEAPAAAHDGPSRDPGSLAPIELEVSCEPERFAEQVETIRRYIEAGDIYQANLTIPMHFPWQGSAEQLFARMMANQPVAYGALMNLGDRQILSASPELFFRRTGIELIVRPMKGTTHRGRDIHEDAARAAWLQTDEKNRAENLMIVDLLRNDLGRVCEPGSIHVSGLFAVETYPSVLQMTSTVRGRMRAGTNYYDLFRSLFPCGSITGAPKIRAMQIIRELEGEPRGIACGAVGYISPHAEAAFSVAIRTLTLRDGEAHLRVGSGITHDSEAAAEFSECNLKAEFLTRDPEPFELIETMRWDGSYFLLDLHMERLSESAAYFGFAFDRKAVEDRLSQVAGQFAAGEILRVRLTMSGSGGLSVVWEPLNPPLAGVTLTVEATLVSSADPFLRHKTTRRALYNRALAEARAAGFDDVLFLNERGDITECALHNVYVERNGERLTPALDCGVLPGVFRAHMLRTDARVREAVLRLEDVLSADRVFTSNAVSGMQQVTSIRMESGALKRW